MDIDFNLEENMNEKKMILATNEVLEMLKNNYDQSLSYLNSFKLLMNNNDYLKLEIKYYKDELVGNEKDVFIDYKNNLEKLQLETNI